MASSFALWRFRRDRGALSSHYWSSTLANDYLTVAVKANQPQEKTEQALQLAGSRYERRVANDIASFRGQLKATDRWHRLTAVLLMSSAFERFFVAAAGAAVASDPTLTPGFPKRIDGLLLKKYALNMSVPTTESIVIGEWSSRISAYRSLFGQVPPPLAQAEGELEVLRRMRNNIAHDFGLDGDRINRIRSLQFGARSDRLLTEEAVHISHERVLRFLAILGEVSLAVDEHLTRDFIGGYETASLYLDWASNKAAFEDRLGLTGIKGLEETVRFRKVLNTLLDSNVVSTEHAKTLRDYVDGL